MRISSEMRANRGVMSSRDLPLLRMVLWRKVGMKALAGHCKTGKVVSRNIRSTTMTSIKFLT